MNKRITLIAILLILLAIVLGAFAAHALKDLISEKYQQTFETGVRYQMYMGISLFIIGLNYAKIGISNKLPIQLIIIGVLLFSLSLYFISLQEIIGKFIFLGPITPVGGVLMIAGWGLIFIRILKKKI
tara:strand:+ start:2245 stop:2628 length:384 start_codon:yes stop_codon:yes gene_type:complete